MGKRAVALAAAVTVATSVAGCAWSQPGFDAGGSFVGTADGTVAAYPTSRSDGCAPAWSVPLGSAVTAAPIVTGGRVIVGTADGRLVAFGLPAE
jgi:outer membrane protein assembly factor BamB